ncbi:hypothetical protein PAESOLCIP111_04764 [Paenibacillus solanacearum]|uniref:Radical SAM core domain-containing protein n=1 Tax=Paenibacillus solanacearum TaxID=2048548 RepID=A0A916NKD4_9BACL|nr:radical SAM protein [Paenibacillus solanacearum]CAG7644664.1 hypothetical protein PAESOLCIP111_04764 [Paenibacillus solanacearum]
MTISRNKLAILINPPIYDTQYWARWSMPHGLLKIATWLRDEGYDLKLYDCLNPYGEGSGIPERVADFESYDAVRKQKKSVVVLASTEEREEQLSYKLKPNEKWKYIFGLPPHELEDQLLNYKNSIARKKYKSVEFWITSIMTYWWESTRDVIELALRVFPEAKIRLGGIYPTLAPWHAEKKLGIDPLLMKGVKLDLNNDAQMDRHLVIFNEVPAASNLDLATDLYDDKERPPYTILTTSRGCPHICSYCASNILNDGTKVRTRTFEDVIAEIKDKFRKNTRVFCFYEDNLLMKMQEFKRILKAVLADKSLQGIKIYAPEGIEIGVALSDRKRYLLKMRSDKSILATLSVETDLEEQDTSRASDIYEAFKESKGRTKRMFIKFEEDLTHGAVVVKEQTDDHIVLVVGDDDEVVLRKVMKENGRADLIYENEKQSSLGLYLVGVPEIVYLMRLAGFEKIYLPLETIKKETNARWNRSWNSNLSRFESLLVALEEVGFDTRKQNINAFVMFGLPGEDLEEIYDTTLYASERVGSVIPMLFTPVPSTDVYEQYRLYIEEHHFDLHHLNGKLFPFFPMLREQMKMKHPEYEIEIADYVRVESFMQRVNSKINGQSVNIYADTKVASTFRQTYSKYESFIKEWI